jgi:hypothetical protein
VQFLIDWIFLCTSGCILNLKKPFGFVMVVLRKAVRLDSSLHSTSTEAPVISDYRVDNVRRVEIHTDFETVYSSIYSYHYQYVFNQYILLVMIDVVHFFYSLFYLIMCFINYITTTDA